MTKKQAYLFGLQAEEIAVLLLRLQGYKVLATRHRTAFGEIDIVAIKKNILAIVEVKARQDLRDCLLAIAAPQQERLVKAASSLLAYPGKLAPMLQNRQWNIRFDLIAITPWRLPRHIKSAWTA